MKRTACLVDNAIPINLKNSSYIDGNKDVHSTVGKKTAVLFTSPSNQAVHLSYETLFLP